MIKISIIVPTLNSSLTIHKTIQSVLQQTFKKFEIIILDSFSKDDTLKKIKSFKSKKIKIYSISSKNKLSHIRYLGILKSKGVFICFLDSDDFWHKEKLMKQYNFMIKKKIISLFNKFFIYQK